MLRNFFNFLVYAILTCGLTRGDFFEECDNINSMYIEVAEDCSLFIFCHDDDSFQDGCPEESPYFSAIDQTCDVNRAVCENRPYGKTDVSNTTSSTSASNSPLTTNTLFAIPTAALTTLNTLNSTTLTTTATAAITITTPSPSTVVAVMACPAIDDPNKVVFLPNPKSCSEYFLCYHGEPLAMHCSNMLHFDTKQQKCDYPEIVSCQLESVTPREQCLPHIFDVFPHATNCNYYYLCSYGYLKVMQCPLKMGWDYEKRGCSLLPYAKCYNSLQRYKF